MDFSLEQKPWWNYIEEDLRELLLLAQLLCQKVGNWPERFHDYSFVVFPAAKAYEGFLKKLFLDLGFISEDDYYGKHFRIGKALNPSLEKELRKKEGVYDKIIDFCQGPALAEQLWQTWKEARNLIFHWFPNEKNTITFEEAKDKVSMVIAAMDAAFTECKIDSKD